MSRIRFHEDGWTVSENQVDTDQYVTWGSNYMTGNGYLGYRGTMAEWTEKEYVACVVTDTYDMADGKWRELCTVPNALYTTVTVNGEEASVFHGTIEDFAIGLDIRRGTNYRRMAWKGVQGGSLRIEEDKFASYKNLHLVAMKYVLTAHETGQYCITTGIDGHIWSLNGEHFTSYQTMERDESFGLRTVTGEFGIEVAVAEDWNLIGITPDKITHFKEEKRILKQVEVTLEKGQSVTLEKYMTVYSSNDVDNPVEQAFADVKDAVSRGYEDLRKDHVVEWEKIWETQDIQIEGDLEAQTALRFNLYHNIIAAPTHTDDLPIGARGLSCQAYQGAAFWDQEIFNMPMFLYSQPEVARNILTYRHKTLDGARGKAKRLGYYGAFYAWISGKTGQELCPSYFFIDVLTGRKIHNHFNSWQIHISPDITYAIWHYFQATGDWQFVIDHGAEVMFEIAQFIVSRLYFKKDKNRYETIRLLGPDEYHENVDNNAYTNYMIKYALEKTVIVWNKLKTEDPETFTSLVGKLGISENDLANWKEIIELMYLPKPEEKTQLIEQFDGYFDLEDVTPEEVKKRLKDPGEYWGWPNGVALETQVIKQADVIQLFCLQDVFDTEVMKKNFDYYEPRTQHGSSLSPSAYGIIASKVGYTQHAYQYFMKSCTIDLYNTNKAVSGGTFIGGIHTAACGAAWQMIVQGFSGFEHTDHGVSFQPEIPKEWDSVAYNLVYRGNILHVFISHKEIKIQSNPGKGEKINLAVNGKEYTIAPGENKDIALH